MMMRVRMMMMMRMRHGPNEQVAHSMNALMRSHYHLCRADHAVAYLAITRALDPGIYDGKLQLLAGAASPNIT